MPDNPAPPRRRASDNPKAPERRQSLWRRRLYALLFAGMIDMDFKTIRRHVYLLICIAFELVILFIWWSALLDLPHYFYAAPPRPFHWQQPAVETVWMLLLLGFVLAVLKAFFKQIRYLEGFLPVCSVCKSIRVGERWVPLEAFMQEHADVRMTHSLCGPCAKKYYGYEEEGS